MTIDIAIVAWIRMETTWKTFYLKVLSAFPALSSFYIFFFLGFLFTPAIFSEMSVLARQMQLEIRQQTAVDSTKQRGANTTKTLGPIICGCSLATETRKKHHTKREQNWKKKITEAANLVTNASQKTEEEKKKTRTQARNTQKPSCTCG